MCIAPGRAFQPEGPGGAKALSGMCRRLQVGGVDSEVREASTDQIRPGSSIGHSGFSPAVMGRLGRVWSRE